MSEPKIHLMAPQYGDDVGSIYGRSECGLPYVSTTCDVSRVTCKRCLKIAGYQIPAERKP
jgi:hypothetical protein